LAAMIFSLSTGSRSLYGPLNEVTDRDWAFASLADRTSLLSSSIFSAALETERKQVVLDDLFEQRLNLSLKERISKLEQKFVKEAEEQKQIDQSTETEDEKEAGESVTQGEAEENEAENETVEQMTTTRSRNVSVIDESDADQDDGILEPSESDQELDDHSAPTTAEEFDSSYESLSASSSTENNSSTSYVSASYFLPSLLLLSSLLILYFAYRFFSSCCARRLEAKLRERRGYSRADLEMAADDDFLDFEKSSAGAYSHDDGL